MSLALNSNSLSLTLRERESYLELEGLSNLPWICGWRERQCIKREIKGFCVNINRHIFITIKEWLFISFLGEIANP
jgi:hypothetical protein